MIWLLFAGCSEPAGEAFSPCTGRSTPLDQISDWTGISEHEVLEAIAVVPTSLTWEDGYGPGPPTSELELTIVVSGGPSIVDHAADPGSCPRSSRELVIPISVDLALGATEATASMTGTVGAREDDGVVVIDAPNASLALDLAIPALSDGWSQAMYDDLDADQLRAPDRWTLGISGAWETAGISVGALGENWVATVWRGRWAQ